MSRVWEWCKIASDRSVVKRAVITCITVGIILTAINHAGALADGRVGARRALQIALMFLVPCLVSTVSSVAAIRGRRTAGLQEDLLLEREIEAINKFPDQNPNPVLRMERDGRLLYANPASAPITSALSVQVGDTMPAEIVAELASAAAESPPEAVEVVTEKQTFAVLPVAVPEFDFVNVYGSDITAAKLLERFPDANPNPVMRVGRDGVLLYGNAASMPIAQGMGIGVGDPLPANVVDGLHRSLGQVNAELAEVQHDGRTYALAPVLVLEYNFINVYGTDVTAMKAIVKFPDQNPNPVLRVTQAGRLEYANPASALIRKALGVEVGGDLPRDFFDQMRGCLERGSSEIVEVASDGRTYELLVVSLFEFGSINLYGTDVTAARAVEQAHRENERLLLNILPASIAQRLRDGETVIADRFDEMTVLFADCVGFTEMSTKLSPAEVVHMLNDCFSVFDRLADRYRLEKIKTIGDAYMVVGGLSTNGADGDHAQRVAEMALDMITEIARLRQESRQNLEIRVGMHIGPAVAGVIGIKKFIYDVWGDTVNTASRMESNGLPGKIQVTEHTYERLKHAYVFEPRGIIEVKGKGAIPAYLLLERRSDTSGSASRP